MGNCRSKPLKGVEKKASTIELRIEKRKLVELQDGITYEGEWLGDRKHGYGIQKWPDGAIFEGNFFNGMANGYGVFIHTDGDKYEGEWQNDRAHGFGTYTHSDGSKYVGEWRNDKKHGKAVETWVDGSKFEGNYAYGLKQGFGRFSWHDNSKYIGNFDTNQINGYGVYYWSDGRLYTGCWLKNHMFGFGKFDWTDNRCYEGQYINDKKDGEGKFVWPDGRAYIGQWRNGKQHGIGIFYNVKGEGRIGEWKDGNRLRWIKNLSDNVFDAEIEGLKNEYTKQREDYLKANDLWEDYKKLPKTNAELQQLRLTQKYDEFLEILKSPSNDDNSKRKESEQPHTPQESLSLEEPHNEDTQEKEVKLSSSKAQCDEQNNSDNDITNKEKNVDMIEADKVSHEDASETQKVFENEYSVNSNKEEEQVVEDHSNSHLPEEVTEIQIESGNSEYEEQMVECDGTPKRQVEEFQDGNNNILGEDKIIEQEIQDDMPKDTVDLEETVDEDQDDRDLVAENEARSEDK
ncbi:hypothetical protein cand_032700 [Cryptosporidium andersoni]|uniref:MORN repeat-containing protein n=1 Tax=Cryptosporidium andersoni TaxID=117008 RepID=A0A1J4MFD6_9CRYT|nr:hypothetical protein cand_032700 [Cryptosporidium andersoni]